MSWIKWWSAKRNSNEHQHNPTLLTAQTNTKNNADFYNNFYSLIADNARFKLVEAMFNLKIFDLFENNACILECNIIEALGLMPIRAKKWLHLLACENFLIKVQLDHQQAYQLTDEFVQLMQRDTWEMIKFYFTLWETAANENLPAVLRSEKVHEHYSSWSWPPTTKDQSVMLEDWMAKTASMSIHCLLKQINFKPVNHLLDVGGGDGTIACALVTAHPHLKATVYNLPIPAEMARDNIKSQELSHLVHVVDGNFFEDDTFPMGFDLILFTRVLFDWDKSKNRKLLKMAYQALPKNGLVVICETFKEYNNDLCLTCEYRYIFIDNFDAHVMKTEIEYRAMLEEIGFSILSTQEKKLGVECSLILAQK